MVCANWNYISFNLPYDRNLAQLKTKGPRILHAEFCMEYETKEQEWKTFATLTKLQLADLREAMANMGSSLNKAKAQGIISAYKQLIDNWL